MAKKEKTSDILKQLIEEGGARGSSEQVRKAYEEALAEEAKLATEKKTAAAERRKELKVVRDAEKKAKAAQIKAAKTAQRAAVETDSKLAKLKERIASSEQNRAPPATPQAPAPSTPASQATGGGFFSDALESSVEGEYNQRDASEGRRALGRIAKSAFRNLVTRPLKATAVGVGSVLSSQYMGLGAPTALAALGYEKLTGGISGMFSGRSGSSRSSGGRSSTNALSSFTGRGLAGSDLSILKRILSETQRSNDTLRDIVDALDRQSTRLVEDNREIKQQNSEIIRLLEAIAAGSGSKSEGSDKKGFWDKLKDGILGGFGSLLKLASGLLSDLFGSVFKLFEGIGGKLLALLGLGGLGLGKSLIKGGLGVAKFIGRGVTKAAGFVAGGMKSLFGKGGAEAAETVAESGIKAAEKTGAEAVEKGTGKAAEKIIAKEGGEAAAKSGAKTAGKGGIKAIVAKVIGPRVGKVIAKSVPFVGALAGLGFGIARAMEGDWKGAGAEVAGGAASIFPGVGTAASVATDVGLLARDVYKEAYGVFPEDDPLASQRMGEVKKEVTDYISGHVENKDTTPPAGTPNPAAVNSASPTSSENAGNVSAVPGSGNTVVPASEISPTLNTAAGFNQGSAQMAVNGNAPSSPTIINNNNVTNVGGGGKGGGAPGRSGGAPTTSPNQSHIDRALYGELYGAGVP